MQAKIGLAVTRCGEWQCGETLREDLSRFHCVHIVENKSPAFAAQNEAMRKCFDDGAEWVVQLDGDMILDQEKFWAEMPGLFSSKKEAGYFLLWDSYIQQNIYSLKVMSKKWLDSGGWFRDETASDRSSQNTNRAKGMTVYDPKTVVGEHFKKPTHFQIFRRWYARGAKDSAGWKDNTQTDYTDMLKGLALDAYLLGVEAGRLIGNRDVHNLPDMLSAYNAHLGNEGLVCGCVVWGDFPYHFQQTFTQKDDPRKTSERDPKLKAAYINRLAIGIGQLMPVPHKMIYLSPEPVEGVVAECQWVKLQSPFPKGNLNKFGMYHADVLALGSRFIFFDLDNVPLRKLDCMDSALKKSNGFLCRSEKLTHKNIPGGDQIGFTRDIGRKIRKWIEEYLSSDPTNHEGHKLLIEAQERFVLREMVRNVFPEHAQYWWELMNGKFILQWKPQVRHNPKAINIPQAVLLTVWGDWKMHDIAGGTPKFFPSQQPWLQIWEDRWIAGADKKGKGLSVPNIAANLPRRKISLLVPTLSRFAICHRLFQTAMAKAKHPDLLDWRIGIVNEDPQAGKYQQAFGNSVYSVAGPVRYIAQINRLAMGAGDENILWVGNDDMVFHTNGWDEIVREKSETFPADGVWAIQGEDGFHRKTTICTQPFISKRFVNMTGQVYPFVFHHVGCDAWLDGIVKRLGRYAFVPELFIEHLHPTKKGKNVEQDATYAITQNAKENARDVEILKASEFMRDHVCDILRGYMVKNS